MPYKVENFNNVQFLKFEILLIQGKSTIIGPEKHHFFYFASSPKPQFLTKPTKLSIFL